MFPQIVPTLGCSREVLSTISEIINVVLDVDTSESLREEVLNKLERRLKYAQQEIRLETLDDSENLGSVRHAKSIAELYRLSGLIYLQRAVRWDTNTTSGYHRIITDAFQILENIEICERTLPLFIVGCEAHTDAQRAIVLRVIDSTQTRFAPNNMLRVRGFIERFWAQDDLDTEQQMVYATKLTAILSNDSGIPAFV
jgi:hypothetical protein